MLGIMAVLCVSCKDWVVPKVHSPSDVCERERENQSQSQSQKQRQSSRGGIRQPASLCPQVFVFINSASLGIFRCLSVCECQSILSRLTEDENV